MIIEVPARVACVCVTVDNPLAPFSKLLAPVITMVTHCVSVIILRRPPLGHVKRSFAFNHKGQISSAFKLKSVKQRYRFKDLRIFFCPDLRSASDIMSGMRDVAPMVSRVQLTATDHWS